MSDVSEPEEEDTFFEYVIDAIRRHDLDMLKDLIDSHPAVLLQTDGSEISPGVMEKVDAGNVVQYLLQNTDWSKYTSLESGIDTLLLAASAIASPEEALKTVENLLRFGVAIDQGFNQGTTAFLHAVDRGELKLAKLLYHKGCNVFRRDDCSRSALHKAADDCRLDFVEWLLSINYCVDALDDKWQTPLMLCVQKPNHFPGKRKKVMDLLIKSGCNVNFQDKDGNTPFVLALNNAAYIETEAIQTLLEAGADINMTDRANVSPLWLAVYHGSHAPYDVTEKIQDIIKLLIAENCNLDLPCCGKMLFRWGRGAVHQYETPVFPIEVALEWGMYEFATILVLAGCYVPELVRQELELDKCPEDLHWIRDYLRSPRTLKQICRLDIRRYLRHNVRQKTNQLELPNLIKSYLLFENVLGEV